MFFTTTVISRIACIGGGRWEGDGVGGGGGWEAGGGLHFPIGLFGVAMSPRNTSHRSREAWRA